MKKATSSFPGSVQPSTDQGEPYTAGRTKSGGPPAFPGPCTSWPLTLLAPEFPGSGISGKMLFPEAPGPGTSESLNFLAPAYPDPCISWLLHTLAPTYPGSWSS